MLSSSLCLPPLCSILHYSISYRRHNSILTNTHKNYSYSPCKPTFRSQLFIIILFFFLFSSKTWLCLCFIFTIFLRNDWVNQFQINPTVLSSVPYFTRYLHGEILEQVKLKRTCEQFPKCKQTKVSWFCYFFMDLFFFSFFKQRRR